MDIRTACIHEFKKQNKQKKRQPHLPKDNYKVEAEGHKSQDLGMCYFAFQHILTSAHMHYHFFLCHM